MSRGLGVSAIDQCPRCWASRPHLSDWITSWICIHTSAARSKVGISKVEAYICKTVAERAKRGRSSRSIFDIAAGRHRHRTTALNCSLRPVGCR
eukprot:scaffold258426_cov30-Tisochrysis_lutea.AAC.5